MTKNLKSPKKLIVILGPTAVGKSALAVKLAKVFRGEIISADSRQVYKGLNIGTGKITKKEMQGIPHYLLDVASPKRKFSVAQYQKLAFKAINKIYQKNKIPFLVGGTGFYIQAVVDNINIPKVKPDWQLRKKLAKKSVKGLYKILKKFDPLRAKTIDKNNPRRLIRAIEVVKKTKKPIPPLEMKPQFDVLMLGLKKDQKTLKKLIGKRRFKRLKRGMVAEVKRLRQNGISWQRLDELGLEYRYLARYLQKKINYEQMVQILKKEIRQFAKRQITWFKRDRRIKWIKNIAEAKRLIKKFLSV
jgi:tRNA dimethylallyltransferase